MVTIDGVWTMEGLSDQDERRVKSYAQLTDVIQDIGFLPLFKNSVKGFSVEEMTAGRAWWGPNPQEDPWEWREVIASEGKVAYGKYFLAKAGFISKEWYPIFASYRRDGYDFDSRYEDGLASKKAKNVIDVLSEYEELPSFELKSMTGFGKGGERGFDGVLNQLQMTTYITVRGFQKKRNKRNEEYGWSIARYSLSERLYGDDYVRCAYHLSKADARDRMLNHLLQRLPESNERELLKIIG